MVYFLLTLFIFSSMEVVSKPLMDTIDPYALTFWRFTAGALFFFFYPGTKKRFLEIRSLSKKDWLAVSMLGFLNTFLAMSFLQVAVKYSSASTAATIFCSNPGFVFIFAVILGYEKFSLKKVVGFFIGITGIFIIMQGENFVAGTGVVFAVFSAIAFASYTLLSKKMVSKIQPLTLNMVAFPLGLAASGIFIALSGKKLSLPLEFFGVPENIIAFFYLGFVVTGIGYVTFFETIKRFSAVSASLIFMLKPAVTTLMAFVLLYEKPEHGFYIGLLSISLGTLLIVWEKLIKLPFFLLLNNK